MGRCLLETRRLQSSRRPEVIPGRVDCVTFSVIPNLTRLWARLMHGAIPDNRARLCVGDCSGGFGKLPALETPIEIFPLLNYLQGFKLDLFMEKVLTSEYVVVSDDDVMWLDPVPWQWAMEQFAADERLAVVSLVPRERFRWEVNGRSHQPMGSYCLIVRSSIWRRERLSFEAVRKPSPNPKSFGGNYDTADYANLELINKGYCVAVAPPEIRAHLVAFKGISSGLIRVQKEPPEGFAAAYHDHPSVVESCLVARGLSAVLRQLYPGLSSTDLVEPGLLGRAEQALFPLMGEAELRATRQRVESQMAALHAGLDSARQNARMFSVR